MGPILFDGWNGLARTLIVGSLAYLLLVLALRLSGKRTLSKMNAFDFIVTVALGSTLATMLLNHDVALAEGVVAFSLLISLQFLVTWTSVRFLWVRRVVTGEPQLLLSRGAFVDVALRQTRITESEVRAAVRAAGVGDMEAVEAVVLETDGAFSVIRRGLATTGSSLTDVRTPSSDDDTGAIREGGRCTPGQINDD